MTTNRRLRKTKNRLLTRHPCGVLRVDVPRCTTSGRLRVYCWRAAQNRDRAHRTRAREGAGIMIEELPGQSPFTRGIYPDMYRSRLWTMRQYAGFGTAEESNRRYRYLLSQGITGLSVAFDLPTQMGMDSDHPLAAGEVGRVGVAVCSLADMQRLFEGIRLADITTSMTINSTAAILLCFYVLVARSQGADLAKISGTIQNDILKEYIARGTYIYPPDRK